MKPDNQQQNQDIEQLKQEHPEIAEALEIFDIGIKEYAEALRFLNEPQTTTTNNTNELLSSN